MASWALREPRSRRRGGPSTGPRGPAHGAACCRRSDGSASGRGVNMPADLRETKTYQWMFEQGRLDGLIEGRLNEARRFVLRQGTKRFGAPDAVAVASLEAIDVLDWLEAIGER